MLDVGEGHRVNWESWGDEQGTPVVFLHGGPGSGFSTHHRELFDPGRYRVVFFDQRGCGRSTPLASDDQADLRTNTTQHLVSDMETLRRNLGIEKWVVTGLSWGTTLALAYAESHPETVTGLVLGFVCTTTRREVEWVTEGVGRIFPEEWERFASAVPDELRHLPLVDAYASMLFDPDASVREQAAREWCAWEDAHVSLAPDAQPDPRYEDPVFRLGFARLVTHYWRNAAFLEDDELISNANRLDGIPGRLIQGRYDISSPLETAWRLSRQWPTSELHVLDDVGHGGGAWREPFADGLASVTSDPTPGTV